MPPFHIQTEVDYVLWVEEQIGSCGAVIPGGLVYDVIEVYPEEYAGAIIPKQIAHLPDGSQLKFDLFVNADLQATKYSFDFRTKDGRLIWRKDFHIGHEDLGCLEHIHRGVEGEAHPDKFDHVEIDEVVREIHQYFEDGTVP